MKIYIEKDGEFYDFAPGIFDEVKNYLDRPRNFFPATPTNKRDFEIGARVYFEGIGWTEVVEQHGCNTGITCALELKGYCADIQCASGSREDKKCAVFKLLEEEREEKQEGVGRIIARPVPDPDPVAHPSHYTSKVPGIECIDVTKHFNFCRGNAIKYLWRAGEKDVAREIEDLQKARKYIDFEIDRLTKEGGTK